MRIKGVNLRAELAQVRAEFDAQLAEMRAGGPISVWRRLLGSMESARK